jgi:hypothetical protein
VHQADINWSCILPKAHERCYGHAFDPSNIGGVRRALPWRTRSKRRSESVGGQPYRHWDLPGYRCRWRAERPRQLVVRQWIFRRKAPQRITKSLSVRRKSLTSAWQRSMSSTRKTLEHPSSTKD